MMKEKWNWITKNKIHFIVWTLFVVYDLGIVSLMQGLFPNPIVDPLHFVINICFFYFHAHVLLRWGLQNNSRTLYLLLPAIILELTVYILTHFTTDKVLIATGIIHLNKVYVLNLNVITRNLYRGIYFMGFSTGYYFLRNYISERKKTEELEKERLEKIIQQQQMEQELVIAQNAFLKAQINPHFLFNSLDFIYHKVKKHSELAGEAVIRLAEMMRFAIGTNEIGSTIYLDSEIDQVENLLYLYKIRKGGDLNVHFFYKDNTKHLRFIPLVILTLVENIFKHGDLTNGDEIAVIDLAIVNEVFVIQTFNLISVNAAKNSNQSGLSNIKNRLHYAYGDAVEFKYETLTNHFKTTIKVPVQVLK